MKQLSAISLLVLMMATTFSKCWLLLGFAANQSVIAATLCENRKVVKSHCNGKCYLRKQMAKQEKQENNPLNNGSKEKFEVILYSAPVAMIQHSTEADIVINYPSYTPDVIRQEAKGIFHPPRA